MNVDFIFFDFGGTIDSDGIHWRKRFYDIYLKNGLNLTYDDFSKAFFDADDNLSIRHDLKNLGFDETVKLQVEDVLKYIGKYDKNLLERISNEFIESSRKKVSENIPLFKYLIHQKKKLGIISNFYGNLPIVLKSLSIDIYFEVIADSTIVGALKPSKDIFNYALTKIGAEPDRSAMIGDSYERDIVGAHSVGMYHFHISENKNYKLCCNKLYIIKNIRELIKYV
ncbi:MAG: HAD family hydrolase [Elusimicrobiales bacterium]|nr:HAD family hydrolase [Elusimicrobiales bacterium]